MSSAIIQLLVLAGIAIFLIIRLRSVLGTRDGFEKPPVPISERAAPQRRVRPEFDVIEGGPDRDITDHVPDGSDSAKALAAMKMAEPGFSVGEFLDGAKGAYEMILMAFENGDLSDVKGFLAPDVEHAFQSVIDQRADQGLSVHAEFVGVREVSLVDASFDRATGEGEMSVRFVGELTSVVRNDAGEIVEGNPNEIKRQRDIWTFARRMGADDPNWHLVATGE
jgi:predicted lipid-binding transport protein (Tim44 family)